jgi:hypothetical protein
VPSKGVWRAQCRFVKRGPAFRAAQGLFSPSAGTGMALLTAVSVQDTLPCRPQVCGERGVGSCDVGQLFKPLKKKSPSSSVIQSYKQISNSSSKFFLNVNVPSKNTLVNRNIRVNTTLQMHVVFGNNASPHQCFKRCFRKLTP